MGGRLLSSGLLVAGALWLLVAPHAAAEIAPGPAYGSPGTAAGEFDDLIDLDVDPLSGKIAVVDGDNKRVQVLSPKGKFLLGFGAGVAPGGGDGPEVCTETCLPGVSSYEAGAFGYPLGVEYSPDGKTIFVSDGSNRRISAHTSKGEFKFAFGYDVEPGAPIGFETCTETCQIGTANGLGGSFENPWGMSISPSGDLFVADVDHDRVQAFTQKGEFVAAIGQDVGGTGVDLCTSIGECQGGKANAADTAMMIRPEGLDFDPKGRLWVASYDALFITRFSQSLAPQLRAGYSVEVGGGNAAQVCTDNCEGAVGDSAAGAFASPQGLIVDGEGTVFVGDDGNKRVSRYGPGGVFESAFGADVIAGAPATFEICTFASGCQAGVSSGTSGAMGPYGLSDDCRGTLYVSDPIGSRIPLFADGTVKTGPCKLEIQKAKKGKLRVAVPYPGKVSLKGRGLKKVSTTHKGLAGIEKLKLKPKSKSKPKGKIKVKVTLVPNDGNVKQKASRKVKP